MRNSILAAILAAVCLPIILQFSAPTIKTTFTNAQFHPHHDDIWAIEFNPKLPFWWYMPKLDIGIPTISTAHFTEDGLEFGIRNQYFWNKDAVKFPNTKYWSYIRSKGKMKDMGLATPNIIYLAMGNDEDPRKNGKIYAVTAKAHVARSILSSAKYIFGLGVFLLFLGARHKPLFPRLVLFFNRYAVYMAGLAGIIFVGWLSVMLTPPVITHKFTADEIYPLHENAWLASFHAEVPPWRMIKANDYLNRIKAENDFRENGHLFTAPNSDCVQEYPSRDLQIKCWDYATGNDLLYATNLKHTEKNYFILFRLPLGEDPRLNGKSYGVNANLVVSKNLSLAVLALCIFLLTPLAWRYAERSGQFRTRLTLCAFAAVIGFVTVTTIFYGGLFQTLPLYLPDSYGYTTLNLIRPLGTWLFFSALKLLGNFDKILIPTQYFMLVGSLAFLSWATGSLLKRQWLGLLLLIFTLSDIIILSNYTDTWSELIYMVLSEPLFLSFFALSLCCLYLLIQSNRPSVKILSALGMGLFLVLADVTRAIGLAFFVMIPLYAMWHIYAARQWRETLKHSLCLVLPIIIVLFGHSAFQKIHYGHWGAGGGGAGLFLLTQTSAIITPERAAALSVADSVEGRDQKQLAINLADQVAPILGKFHAASWPYERAMIWAYDPHYSFDPIMHDYTPNMRGITHATNDLYAQFYPELLKAPDLAIRQERLMRATALTIIAAHPVDFSLHILSEFLIAKLYLGNGLFGNFNFLLPMTFLTLIFMALSFMRPQRRDYAGLAITGLTTLAYIFAVCIMEPPFLRYIMMMQIPSTVVVFAGLLILLCDLKIWLSQYQWYKGFVGNR
ncbi:MAG: hypothetical protein ORN98_10625 [Alphaproteobacteria bacterium]|nr:hypothetical protein [Alphaproteobacteria bacterium]